MSNKAELAYVVAFAVAAATTLCAQVTSVNGGVDFAPLSSPFQNPVGLSASPTRLLMTTAGCANIWTISDTGIVNPTPYAVIPPHPVLGSPSLDCEAKMATSPGLNGFPADTAYVVQGNLVYQLPPASNALSLFATVPISALGATGTTFPEDVHADLTFDSTGAFNNVGPSVGTPKMIVTISQGIAPSSSNPFSTTIWLVDSTGASTPLLGSPFGTRLEGPSVVPMNDGGSLAGKIIIGGEFSGFLYSIDTTGTVTSLSSLLPSPESTEVVPPQLCTFGNGGNTFFTTQYLASFDSRQNIQAYPPSSFTGSHGVTAPAGSILVPTELVNNSIGLVTFSGGVPTYTPGGFDTNTPFVSFAHEGSTFVTCLNSPGTGCPATKGFWKNAVKHPFPNSLAFPVKIGGVSYTAANLYTILGANASGGNAVSIMGSQLVAALLNIAAGAAHSTAVDQAIANAQSLLQVGLPGGPAGVTFPINMTTDFVQSGTALGQAMVNIANYLTDYNGANFGTCTEGAGLTLGK